MKHSRRMMRARRSRGTSSSAETKIGMLPTGSQTSSSSRNADMKLSFTGRSPFPFPH